MEGDTIKGVIVESQAGREAILAERIIDATGDADVAHRAGAITLKQAKEDMIGASVMFSMSGVNKTRFIEHVKSDPQTYRDWAYFSRLGDSVAVERFRLELSDPIYQQATELNDLRWFLEWE